MNYKYAGIDHFTRETIELTREILSSSEKIGSHGMHKYRPANNGLSEDDAFLRKLCADFMGYEFDGIDFPEINYSLLNRSDEVYNDWVQFANAKGVSQVELIQAGWEMIFGGEFSYVPALQKFY